MSWLSGRAGSLSQSQALGSTPGGTTFLSVPLQFQRVMDSDGPDYLWLDGHYWSSDCGGVPSIELPIYTVFSLTILHDVPSYLCLLDYAIFNCKYTNINIVQCMVAS